MEFQDNAQLGLVIESAPIGICILDSKTFVAELLNDKFLEIAGKPRESIIGKWYWEPFAEARAYYEDALKSVPETGKAYYADEVEMMLVRYGKEERIFVTFVYAPVKNKAGEITKIAVWVLENTTQVIERQKVTAAKAAIETERDRLYEFFLKAPAGICVLSGPQLTYELVNPNYQTILPGRELLGRPILDAVPELIGSPLAQVMQDTYHKGTPYEVHELLVPIAQYEGGPTEDRYFTFNFMPRKGFNEDIDGIFNFVFEVTEQVIARKKIEESESHFRHLADLVPAKISNALPSGEVTFFNKHWLDFAGMSFEDMRDFGYYQMMHPDEISEFQQKLAIAAQTGEPLISEMRFKNTAGQYIWHLNIASPILDENRQVTMWVGSTTDIQKLKEEEQRKADFVSMLSHELKTPVTSIKGYIQLMQREISNNNFSMERFIKSLDRVDRLVRQLTSLVADMLDLSRIETARLDLLKKPADLNALVTEVVEDFRLTTSERTIALEQNGQFTVDIDRDKIAQVLINVISNAIKYSPNKTPIRVSINLEGKNSVMVSVTDEGIGIDKKDHNKIFERFYRVEGKDEHHFSGFGIGLYLAHSIIARHNGEFTIDSSPGQGSTFSFILQQAEK